MRQNVEQIRWLVLLIAMLLIGAAPEWVEAQELDLPPIPEDAYFIQDHAGVVPHGVRGEIGRLQQEAFERYDTPIIVVTIGSMAEYGGAGMDIEWFARHWFNHWEIGKRDAEGELVNRGMLLLVSVGDRKARIELGAEWGTAWDGQAQRIMDQAIVPAFKRGDYGQGALAGTMGLRDMAERGPDAPPSFELGDLMDRMQDKPMPTTPLPLWGIVAVGALGVGLLVASFFVSDPQHRKWLLISGVVLIVSALLLWIVAVLISVFLRSRWGGGGGAGGGFSSGGGFGGGGFSGGGGATGSW